MRLRKACCGIWALRNRREIPRVATAIGKNMNTGRVRIFLGATRVRDLSLWIPVIGVSVLAMGIEDRCDGNDLEVWFLRSGDFVLSSAHAPDAVAVSSLLGRTQAETV